MSTGKPSKLAENANLSTFEGRVREAFNNKPVTQIAEEVGISYQKLRNYLVGRSDIPTTELIRLAKTANCSIDWLLTGEGPRQVGGASIPVSPVEEKKVSLEEVLDQKIEEIVDRKLRMAIMEIQFESLVPTDGPITRIPVPIIDAYAGGEADEPFRIKPSDDDTGSNSRRSDRRKAG